MKILARSSAGTPPHWSAFGSRYFLPPTQRAWCLEVSVPPVEAARPPPGCAYLSPRAHAVRPVPLNPRRRESKPHPSSGSPRKTRSPRNDSPSPGCRQRPSAGTAAGIMRFACWTCDSNGSMRSACRWSKSARSPTPCTGSRFARSGPSYLTACALCQRRCQFRCARCTSQYGSPPSAAGTSRKTSCARPSTWNAFTAYPKPDDYERLERGQVVLILDALDQVAPEDRENLAAIQAFTRDPGFPAVCRSLVARAKSGL